MFPPCFCCFVLPHPTAGQMLLCVMVAARSSSTGQALTVAILQKNLNPKAVKIKRYSDRKNRNCKRIEAEVEEFSSFFHTWVPQHLSMGPSALVSEGFPNLIVILAVIIFPSLSTIYQNLTHFSVQFQAFLRSEARCLAVLLLSCSISQTRDSQLDSVVFSSTCWS